jgi:hypothetical protein
MENFVKYILDDLQYIRKPTEEQIAAITRQMKQINAASGSQKGNLTPCPPTTKIASCLVVNGHHTYGLVEISIDEFFKIIKLLRIMSTMDICDESSRLKMMELVKMKLEGKETNDEAQGMISSFALKRLQNRGCNPFFNYFVSRIVENLFIDPDHDSYL